MKIYIVMILDQHQIFFIEYRRTNYGKFSLKYRGAQIWNNLPNTLKISKTYRSFKKSAKVYVQNQTTLNSYNV